MRNFIHVVSTFVQIPEEMKEDDSFVRGSIIFLWFSNSQNNMLVGELLINTLARETVN
jgi:hypothetical protein